MEDLTRILQNLLSREAFFVVGNLFSIASFVLTVFVLWNVRKLRNVYRLKARGPSLIKDLSKSASNPGIKTRLQRARDYLVKKRGLAPGRIVIQEGGRRDEVMIQLYISPVGAPPPSLEP